MDRTRLIEKIKKCLALGKSPFPGEAVVALEKAREIMDAYNITPEDITLAEISGKRTEEAAGARSLPHYLKIH